MRAAGGDVNVSVNISAKQLREPDFVSKVERALATMGGAGLILEITERDGIGNDAVSLDAMKTLADRGVPFAIDDFGIGFSSIGYLQDMPVQIIKTDVSFSESIDRDERSCALLCSITMMGQALGLDVVVEGIERSSQLDHLREHVHAPYAQGYLMHRPMPLDQLLEVLAREPGARRAEPAPETGSRPVTRRACRGTERTVRQPASGIRSISSKASGSLLSAGPLHQRHRLDRPGAAAEAVQGRHHPLEVRRRRSCR